MAYRIEDGWRKVGDSSSISFASATLFNVLTGDEVTVWTRDYDRWDANECDAPEWYEIRVDDDARKAWCRKHGRVDAGMVARVVKGRKVPIGYTGVVERIRKVYDKYDRWVANYVVFEDGTSTNLNNCVLSED